MAIHEDVVWADVILRAHGGFVIFFADDGRFIGPPSVVYRTMIQFESRIFTRLSLRYNKPKCGLWFRTPSDIPAFQQQHPD